MADLQQLPAYQMLAEQQDHDRLVARLADELARRTQIRAEDNHLVWHLGDGDEKTNIAALKAWIQQALPSTNTTDRKALADQMENRLLSHLSAELEF